MKLYELYCAENAPLSLLNKLNDKTTLSKLSSMTKDSAPIKSTLNIPPHLQYQYFDDDETDRTHENNLLDYELRKARHRLVAIELGDKQREVEQREIQIELEMRAAAKRKRLRKGSQ